MYECVSFGGRKAGERGRERERDSVRVSACETGEYPLELLFYETDFRICYLMSTANTRLNKNNF